MLPLSQMCLPPVLLSRWAVNAAVVLLPFAPVMPIIGAGHNSKKMLIWDDDDIGPFKISRCMGAKMVLYIRELFELTYGIV
jgi:hypothetical protein